MRYINKTWLLAPLGILLGGCATSEKGALERWLPEGSATSTWSASDGRAEFAGGSEGSDQPIPAGAGPAEYVRLALERNPAIAAAQYRVRRMAARIPQVTSLEDPMLELAPIGEMAETAAGMVGVMTGVSQKLPFPGKLPARGDLAGAEVAQAAAELEQVKLEVVADVRRAYWSYYFAGRAIEVTEQTRELLRQFREIADARFRAGQGSQADVLRASVEFSTLDNELNNLGQQQATAAAMLNSLLDRPVNAALPRPRAAELVAVAPRLETLLRQAAAANPEIEKIRQRIEGEGHRQKLARLERYPDLTVSVNYNLVDSEGLSMAANGQDQWWIGFGINVPIWFDKYRAGEREALRGRQEAIADLGAARNRVAFRVQDALVRVETQQRQVQLFRDVIIPQARQTVEASRAGYQAGQVDFLMLVDNWRRQLNYELLYHQNLSQLEKDFAELEQVVGRNVERAPAGPPATNPQQRSQDHE